MVESGDEGSTVDHGDRTPRSGHPEDRVEGKNVDRYVLLEMVGIGGMGKVFRAYDPKLEREVAIKALRHRSKTSLARMQREAQALAQMSHPNVVAVYDVLAIQGAVYIAMEFVRGPTLRGWAADGRSWREMIEMLIQAGEGLSAAHGAGLLHRDFKPANVMVGEDDRARVMDFGLARGTGSTSGGSVDSEGGDTALEERLTHHGDVMGTPAYMSPEQHRGNADARSDQYSFCVTAYEMLYGRRPFDETSRADNLHAKGTGVIRRPDATKVPSEVLHALCRGMDPSPDGRWESVESLLARLRRVLTRRRRWSVAAGGAVAVVSVGAAIAIGLPADATCSDAAPALSDAERDAAREAILATELAHAEATWERIERFLGAYATEWGAAHDEACGAAGLQLDLRIQCLARRRSELRALVETLAEADAVVAEHAVDAVLSLPPISDCADDAALASIGRPPDPELAAAIAPQTERLAVAKARAAAGKDAEALAIAQGVRAAAEQLGAPRLLAEADLQLGGAHSRLGRHEVAAESFRAAYFGARRVGADDIAVAAAIQLVRVLGARLSRHEEALDWVAHARADLDRVAGDLAAIELDSAEAVVLSDKGEYDKALHLYERSRAAATALGDRGLSHASSALSSIGVMHFKRGRYEEALAYIARALEGAETRLGPEHPALGGMLSNLGGTHDALGHTREAIAAYERSVSIREAAWGPKSTSLVTVLINLGAALTSADRDDEALSKLRRALAILDEAEDPPPAQLGPLLNNIGIALSGSGDPAAALRHHERALVVFEGAYGDDHPEVAVTTLLLGSLLREMGKLERALVELTKARERVEGTLGPEHRRAGEAAYELGRLHQEMGKPDLAVPLLDLAVRVLSGEPGASTDAARRHLAEARSDLKKAAL